MEMNCRFFVYRIEVTDFDHRFSNLRYRRIVRSVGFPRSSQFATAMSLFMNFQFTNQQSNVLNHVNKNCKFFVYRIEVTDFDHRFSNLRYRRIVRSVGFPRSSQFATAMSLFMNFQFTNQESNVLNHVNKNCKFFVYRIEVADFDHRFFNQRDLQTVR
jgi:hypothetical protein